MNHWALRNIVIGLGGSIHGVPREMALTLQLLRKLWRFFA